jgi:hypothetical protein
MCGEMIAASAVKCRFCGHYFDPSLKPRSSTGMTDSVLPTDMPWSAILSLYLGLGSFLFIFAPFSVIISIIALRTLKNEPELSGRGRAWFGLIAGIIGTALLVLMIVAITSETGHHGR